MLKNTLITFALAVTCLLSCKDEPKAPSETTQAVETPKLDLIAVEKTSREGADKIVQMDGLIQELNNLPPALKSKEAVMISAMVEELNGMKEKEAGMVTELNAMLPESDQNKPVSGVSSVATPTPDPATQTKMLKDISEDMKRYHERLEQMKNEVKALKN